VDCVPHTRYLPIPLLTCTKGAYWCAVVGSVERSWAAKKRPVRLDRPDASYRRVPLRMSSAGGEGLFRRHGQLDGGDASSGISLSELRMFVLWIARSQRAMLIAVLVVAFRCG
jgi:hypothetical protein